MDFGTLLHTAKQNEQHDKKEIRYYSTKFAPPKKEKKENRTLSANIQKFLAKKEYEERQKAEEAKKKREELLSLRSQDKKATRRVNVMLKRTKSANQSVIQDAIDNDNTAVTLAGPSQPDEDDYGYVSQEASAFYNKMMEKYSKMPEEPKFSKSGKKVSTNLSSTKDRVRAALEKEKEEAMMPHKRKRKHAEVEEKEHEEDDQSVKKENNNQTPKPKMKPMPPPMNFMEILKLAEKKQHEPIIIPQKPKDGDGPLMTKKQKREYEKEKQRLEAKEARMKMLTTSGDKIQKPKPHDNGFKVPKLSENQDLSKSKAIPRINGKIPEKKSELPGIRSKVMSEKNILKDKFRENQEVQKLAVLKEKQKPQESKNKQRIEELKELHEKQKLLELKNKQRLEELKELQELEELREKQKQLQELERQKLQKLQKIKEKEKLMQNISLDSKLQAKSADSMKYKPSTKDKNGVKPPTLLNNKMKEIQPKKFPPDDLLPKQSLNKDSKPKQFPPKDLKPKQFPPSDVRQRPQLKKRRILDDDEEYDSEMDDFIDDGPEEEQDYSQYIRDIFGYDKTKFRNIDDDDIEESSFHQQWKEEMLSTKIGIMEDLEDMKKEEEEKRRKALLKKRKL